MKLFFMLFFLIINQLSAADVSFSIIKTGEAKSKEFLIYENGEFLKDVMAIHSAILIKHNADYILFDTGLGIKIDEQFKSDMPWWGKVLFKYTKTTPAKIQLAEKNISIKDIYLSHLHWDHASGLVDFDHAQVNVPKEEFDGLRSNEKIGAFFPSQFMFDQSKWKKFEFENKSFMGFEKSFDIFNDKSAVIVSLPGHTKGSVGLILSLSKSKYFFIGDLVWSVKALENLDSKFFLAKKIVDGNPDQVRESMAKVREFMNKYPDVKIIPAHDGEVFKKFDFFPNWISE